MPDLIYLDNAATVFPRPQAVLDGMIRFYATNGISPGRSGSDLALAAGGLIDETRRMLHDFFGNPDPDPNRLIFGANATDALNTAFQGTLRHGDHVLTTELEHNSVLRPLQNLVAAGRIHWDLLPFADDGRVDPAAIVAHIRPETRLVVINHASNVLGSVQDLDAIGRICRDHGLRLLVDAAQSAGLLDIDMGRMNIDLLAFTGHKALQGPTGIGGLAVGPGVDVATSRFGGTGVDSADLDHPARYPYRLEAGTPNLLGITGLKLGLEDLLAEGREIRLARELELRKQFCAGAVSIPGLRLLGPTEAEQLVPVISCLIDRMTPDEIGQRLDVDYGIVVRTGLHCAPLLHTACGTLPDGATRFSFGAANTPAEIDVALGALADLAAIAAAR